MGSTPPDRIRRASGWWEPTYNPKLVGKMAKGGWSFENDRGPHKKIFYGNDLTEEILGGRSKVIDEIIFKTCDFQGFYQSDTQIIFKGCQFIDCDLALTTWINVKFSKCRFISTSFGMTKFERCDFRECYWEKIGLSANETELVSTLINNPAKMIASAYTNLDSVVLRMKNATKINQVCKLETTKATVARQILKSFEKAGDEKSYYEAVKTFELQQAKGRIYDAFRIAADPKSKALDRFFKAVTCPFWILEYSCLYIIGIISGWGASIVRPLLFSILTFFIFAKFYQYYPNIGSNVSPYRKSLDISLLAGFTSYFSETDSLIIKAQGLQLIISCFLYSLTFAAILSRFSRVR